jgi:hypothetical protein
MKLTAKKNNFKDAQKHRLINREACVEVKGSTFALVRIIQE